jgi:glycosyltransferase involved in cell wall biosynthesis
MKIAIRVPSWPPGSVPNGIVTYASYLVPALRGLGHEVFVLARRKMTEDDDPHTIDLQRYASNLTLWQRAAYRFIPHFAQFRVPTARIISAVNELIIKHRIDVLEMEDTFGWSFAISRLNLLPVVVRLHGPWFATGRFEANRDSASNIRREVLEGKGIQWAHYVTAPTAEVLAAVKARYGLSLPASTVIANPIKAYETSMSWNIRTCNHHTFLFVGRFDERKGGDLVLRAFVELGRMMPEVRLLFVGPDKGIRTSSGLVVSYEHFVRANVPEALRSRIEFCGPLGHADVMELRTKCFATIFPSRYEVAPYAILEAMSLGCPLVATSVGGIPEVIQNRRSGLLISPENEKAIAAACRDLITNPDLAAKLGHRAWLDCRERYEPMLIAKQTIAAYEQAIDAFKSKPQ